jgi:branched-subunit amino acid transport protein
MALQEFFLVFGMAVVTFACRYPVLALVSRVPLPGSLLETMGFIPPAVLAAIIALGVVMPHGRIALTMQNNYLVAGLVAMLVAWRSQNLLLTIVLGMITLWTWGWLTPV